jgi:D-alanyl-D-alanine carboxypeptidase
MRKLTNILSALIFAAFCLSANADLKTDAKKAIQEFVQTHPDLNAVYAFDIGCRPIEKGASGYFSIGSKTKLKPDQKMLIASGTKNIIAAAILKLEEAGKLNVEDTLDKHFPATSEIWQEKDKNKFPNWASQITIHDLLVHSSGLKEYVFNMQIDPTKTHEEINQSILHFAASTPLLFAPGEKHQYCNTGYVILGMIIENISKTPLKDYLDKTFFAPLRMKNTHMSSLQEAVEYRHGKLKNYPELYFAYYYNDKFSLKRAETNFFFVPYADGGIISTTSDMLKWHRKLHNGKILSKKSYSKMMTVYQKSPSFFDKNRQVGYGIFISKLNDKDTMYYHSGNAAGIRSETGYIPSKNFGFALISNVMPVLDEKKIAEIDMTKNENQLDIYFLLNYVLKSALQAYQTK